MTMVSRLNASVAILGLAAAITSAFVWGDASGLKSPVSGLKPGAVKLNENIMSNRFVKQPVVTYETQSGETLFAVQVKPALKAPPARPRDIVVAVDTSASQAGKFLTTSRLVFEQIANDAAGNDRISLWVVNTAAATRNLSGGLKYAKKETVVPMLRALDNEYASGAVELKNAVEKILRDFDGKVQRQQIIVYIGDAESAAAPLSEKERYHLANKVRDAKVQFFAVPIGTNINGLNMHSLVTGTGGSVVRFSDIRDQKTAVDHVAKSLNEAIGVPVMFPAKVQYATETAELYPTRLPPLRGDAPTLVAGKFIKGKTPARFEATIEGRIGGGPATAIFSAAIPAPEAENFFLATIVRQWSESSMKDAPAILRADRTLALAFEQGRLTRDEYLAQAQWALGANQLAAAGNLAEAAHNLDPSDGEVKALDKILDKINKGELTLEKLKISTGNRIGTSYRKDENGQLQQIRVNLEQIAVEPPAAKATNPAPAGSPNDLLRAEEARRAILEQQVRLTVDETLARGRELLRNADPKGAKDLILAQRDSIRANPDIGSALRSKLLLQMDNLLTDIGQRGELFVRAKAEENERIARVRAKLMQTDTIEAREERTRERVKAFANLMSQARYEDAYREALVANQEAVNEGRQVPLESQAVYQIGQAATNLREMRELTRIREDRFLLTMLQVEKAHIPYPDEPPVHFPPSKVWRELSETRKRYAIADFEGDLPPRVARRMEFLKSALENPIAEIEKADIALPFLLETLGALASPPGSDKDPSRRVTILVDVDAFKREKMDMFDLERIQIKFPTKLVGVSLSTVLRLICEQLDGTYWVRRDYIEIVPADLAIREKVIRVFPVADLIVGIPNAANQAAISQSLAVLGATFSLGGGFTGAPIAGAFGGGVMLGNIGGFGGGEGGIAGGAIGGLFQGGNGGPRGGIAGFSGGIMGNIGNQLGGQFGFQGADYGPLLIQLITQVVAQGEWTINQNAIIGAGGAGGMQQEDPDPNQAPMLPPEKLNKIGYWPPAKGLIITGTSRFHRTNSSKLPKGKDAAANFVPDNKNQANLPGKNGAVQVVIKADPPKDAKLAKILKENPNLDPETVYREVLKESMTDPGEVIACADFMVKCRKFKDAAELLKASLKTGITAEPWVHEALVIALEGSQGSAEEIERARLSAIDLSPKSSHAYLKAAQAMSVTGDPDRALKFCRIAARLEPNLPDPYINGLVYASDKKATLDAEMSAWMAGKLLGQEWTSDTLDYHFRAREHLKEVSARFAAQGRLEEAKKVRGILDNEKCRDLVIQLLWSGPSDLDLKVREPIGTNCSSQNRQTSGGGVLMCDDYSQKDDNRSETYTTAEAFSGTYLVSVDRVWGRSLGEKATIRVVKNQGSPRQTIEIHTLDLKKQMSLTINLDGGQRQRLAVVPPIGAPADSIRKPERERQVMDRLRAMTNGTTRTSGMRGGAGKLGTDQGFAGNDEGQSPLVGLSLQSSVNWTLPGSLDLRQQTVVSKDGRNIEVKMAQVFQTAGAGQAKLKFDFIPGVE